MTADLTRYELRVRTLLSRAALATFHIPVTPTAIPRNTVYRFRIPADRDPSEVLHRLTECDVQVLEIRRCADVSRRDGRPGQPRRGGPPPETGGPAAATAGVVIPFPARTPPVHPAPDATRGGWSPAEPGSGPDGDGSAG
jgi:hypothetical protein